VREDRARELVDHQLRRLDVHVRVDVAGHEVLARPVEALAARNGAARRQRGDTPLGHRHVDVEPLARERREDRAPTITRSGSASPRATAIRRARSTIARRLVDRLAAALAVGGRIRAVRPCGGSAR
jgi:hypothetical protein